MSGNTAIGFRPKFRVPGDWNILFGICTNTPTNVLALTGETRDGTISPGHRSADMEPVRE
jgi:hypothetical protein